MGFFIVEERIQAGLGEEGGEGWQGGSAWEAAQACLKSQLEAACAGLQEPGQLRALKDFTLLSCTALSTSLQPATPCASHQAQSLVHSLVMGTQLLTRGCSWSAQHLACLLTMCKAYAPCMPSLPDTATVVLIHPHSYMPSHANPLSCMANNVGSTLQQACNGVCSPALFELSCWSPGSTCTPQCA